MSDSNMLDYLSMRADFIRRLRDNARANALDSVYFYLHGVLMGLDIAKERLEQLDEPKSRVQSLDDEIMQYEIDLYEKLRVAMTDADARRIISNHLSAFLKEKPNLSKTKATELSNEALERMNRYYP